MCDLYFLREGRGEARVAGRSPSVNLEVLEYRTRDRTLWFISDSELPCIGESTTGFRVPARFVAVHVARGEETGRFDRAGFWLYRSLSPVDCKRLLTPCVRRVVPAPPARCATGTIPESASVRPGEGQDGRVPTRQPERDYAY